MTTPDAGLDVLRDLLAEQPLVKRYSNTVTSLIGLAVNVVWVLVGLGVEIPLPVLGGIAITIQTLATVGIRFTPNGVTEKQVIEIEEYAGRHREIEN
ncbi:hypothetical protein CH249_01780 [Rhodococcus sp. 05-2255-3B1]|uniref:hypothetical protein n=1 Tax=unclassified Rhodococcus (in: high G+C Gram-positive bacteria) TaxID=192944 RepID=UPI000B9AC970|nr:MULTISPECIES: hypothetical protein [unclassified Rhodococcus (in: high G+C Gram-positive bacteria)]OZE13386.1 hypothetical protein CH250_05585 [Rhodococcus sp. 05-2255-3C]OZE16001.1 hypothetical protein CH249_01780 [Rhodococcus sp. 05-2255-3B1]OZE19041.1 hypothetical protein CH255_13805 [Rhodococcus sp. 05-2255-2A2]